MKTVKTKCVWIETDGRRCGVTCDPRYGLCLKHRVAEWEQTRDLVHRALDNATDNGYDVLHVGTDLVAAEDIVQYDADLEDRSAEDIEPHVKSWREARR